jgi:predicted branched-subunit amino acid permease
MRLSNGYRAGVREALGVPTAVLAAGYIGYGAIAADMKFPVLVAMLSTAAIWALPGQIILMEMSGVGAPALVILLAVMLSAMRFLPMTVTLMPMLRAPQHGRVAEYFAAQLIAMTGWAIMMRSGPDLPQSERLPFFTGLALTGWMVSIAATGAGFLVADMLPLLARIGFVFLSPLYFAIVLLAGLRERMMAMALVFGAIFGPVIYTFNPQWSVLAGGLIGGSLAFALRHAGRQHG